MNKTIGELLAFLVLSAWPLAMLTFFLIATIAIWRVVRRTKAQENKWAAGLNAAIIIILVPTWDVIAGRIQYSYLCATESGVKVYKRVRLESEYFPIHFSGNPLAYERLPISKRYPYSYDSSEDVFGSGKIKFNREILRDGQTKELLGTFTSYFWGGGWFEQMFSVQGAGGGSCGHETGGFQALVEQIFEIPR